MFAGVLSPFGNVPIRLGMEEPQPVDIYGVCLVTI